MNLKLKSLHIKNFKGLKDTKIEPNGSNYNVFGDNSTGKTTIMDSFLWLLFNKNSEDKSAFTVKPQDENGQDIHHLQTQVEAELLLDGKILKIKKMQEEKWTKRHGALEKELTGNTLLYWYDEVPVKEGEYKRKISELIDEDIFKMVTNPLYFNTKIDWKKRREILLQISGDMTNEQVIASDESLSKLSDLLSNRSIDDYKLVLADQLKGYKKERDDIPPRIDELTLSLPQIEPDYATTEKTLLELKTNLANLENELTSVKDETLKLNKKQQEVYLLTDQLRKVKEQIKSDSETDRRKAIDEKMKLDNQEYQFKQTIEETHNRIETVKSQIKSKESELQSLRTQWTMFAQEKADLMAKEFIQGELNTTCPTCEQDLPKETIENKQNQLKENFEKDKQSQLSNINSKLENNSNQGKSTKASLERLIQTEKDLLLQIPPLEKQIKEIQEQLITLNTEIEKPIEEPEYTNYPEYVELIEKIEQLRVELEKPVEDKSTELLQKKSEIQTQIDECNKILNGKSDIEKKKLRIEQLKAEEKRVSTLIAELEGNKYLLEQFVVAKVNLLEDSINNQFKHVKFKLFEENITNDGIKETCIALVNTNGSYIKFEDANSAGRINAGIDILNSLSRFYEVSAPLWIDNRESVTKLADTKNQVISLIVSEKDKVLRVGVTKNEKMQG